jgi:hypothetical protein
MNKNKSIFITIIIINNSSCCKLFAVDKRLMKEVNTFINCLIFPVNNDFKVNQTFPNIFI